MADIIIPSKVFMPENCDMCGKSFVPAPQHIYKIQKRSKNNSTTCCLYCSYTCYRKAQKEIENKKVKKGKQDEYL